MQLLRNTMGNLVEMYAYGTRTYRTRECEILQIRIILVAFEGGENEVTTLSGCFPCRNLE